MTPDTILTAQSNFAQVGAQVHTPGTRPAAGSSVVVWASNFYGGGGTAISVSDNHGNTWDPVVFSTPPGAGGNAKVGFWLCSDIAYISGAALNISVQNAIDYAALTSGAAIFSEKLAIDQYGTADAYSTTALTPTTPTLNYSPGCAFSVFHCEQYSGVSITEPSGWTSLGEFLLWDPELPSAAAYKATTDTSAVAAAWTCASANILIGLTAVFYEIAPPTPSTVTISGYGQLPTTYPITLTTLSPTSLTMNVGATNTVTVTDQNGVPVIGATIAAPAGLTVSSPTNDLGQFTVTAVTSGTRTVTISYTDPTNGQSQKFLPVTVNATVPTNPSGLTATAHASILGRIDLAWTDNSNNETGFEIDRAPDSSGLPGTWATIHTTAAGVTSYSNTGLSNATKYWYRVRATNAQGDSLNSNTASATTKSVAVAAPSIAIVQQAVTLADGSSVQAFTVVDQDSNPVDFAQAAVSKPGFVTVSSKVVNGSFNVAPAGVGVATVTVTYDHPTAGLLTATTVVTVTPRTS